MPKSNVDLIDELRTNIERAQSITLLSHIATERAEDYSVAINAAMETAHDLLEEAKELTDTLAKQVQS